MLLTRTTWTSYLFSKESRDSSIHNILSYLQLPGPEPGLTCPSTFSLSHPTLPAPCPAGTPSWPVKVIRASLLFPPELFSCLPGPALPRVCLSLVHLHLPSTFHGRGSQAGRLTTQVSRLCVGRLQRARLPSVQLLPAEGGTRGACVGVLSPMAGVCACASSRALEGIVLHA